LLVEGVVAAAHSRRARGRWGNGRRVGRWRPADAVIAGRWAAFGAGADEARSVTESRLLNVHIGRRDGDGLGGLAEQPAEARRASAGHPAVGIWCLVGDATSVRLLLVDGNIRTMRYSGRW